MTTEVRIGGAFSGLLALLFIALKLTHHIDWSWLWVLAPLWMPFALAIMMFACVVTFALAMTAFEHWGRGRK